MKKRTYKIWATIEKNIQDATGEDFVDSDIPTCLGTFETFTEAQNACEYLQEMGEAIPPEDYLMLYVDVPTEAALPIDNPERYLWAFDPIPDDLGSDYYVEYYPKRKLDEDELHLQAAKLVRECGLPPQSLDEIPSWKFTQEQAVRRAFILQLFEQFASI